MLTLVAEAGAPAEDHDGLEDHFTAKEKVKPTPLICAVNSWNQIAIGFRSVLPSRRAAG